MQAIVRVNQLKRHYRSQHHTVKAVDDVSFQAFPGELTIVGASGSGKSTLLSLLAGLEDCDSGELWIGETPLHQLTQEDKAAFRRRNVGFVFQSYQLFDSYTALENVLFPLELSGMPHSEAKSRAISLLEQVGLRERRDHYPRQLSGGEQQRVSVARAFATQPALLLADEPTGNLDSETGKTVMSFFNQLQQEQGSTLLMVTHDEHIAAMADRRLHMKDGRLISPATSQSQPSL